MLPIRRLTHARIRCARCRPRTGATLTINRQTGQRGTGYNSRLDLARAPLTTAAGGHITSAIEPNGTNAGKLVLRLGSIRLERTDHRELIRRVPKR